MVTRMCVSMCVQGFCLILQKVRVGCVLLHGFWQFWKPGGRIAGVGSDFGVVASLGNYNFQLHHLTHTGPKSIVLVQ